MLMENHCQHVYPIQGKDTREGEREESGSNRAYGNNRMTQYEIEVSYNLEIQRFQFSLTKRFRFGDGIKTTDVSCFASSELLGLFTSITELLLRFTLLCLPLLFGGLVLSPRFQKAKSGLCFSFIRQMSPSQAMSNHSAPSVRLHPPGLVFSLLASVPCHGLAPTLAYQALFLGKACRCFVSVWLYLFVSVCFISHPALFFSFLSPLLLFLSVLLTQTYQLNGQTDYARKRENKKGKIFFPP